MFIRSYSISIKETISEAKFYSLDCIKFLFVTPILHSPPIESVPGAWALS